MVKKLVNKLKEMEKIHGVIMVLAVAFILLSARLIFPKTVAVSKQNEKKLPIYCVDTPDKKVAISFDAAWGADDTDNLLNILKDNGVKTTFFLCGYWIDKYPEEVKKIASQGHDIGNHGDTHAHSSQLSLENNKKELMAVHEKVKALTGIEMNLFRPPFGEYNNTVLEAAEACGYYTIQWDVDSLDIKEKLIIPLNINFIRFDVNGFDQLLS